MAYKYLLTPQQKLPKAFCILTQQSSTLFAKFDCPVACQKFSLLVTFISFSVQKPANILVMGEGPERGRVKIGKFVHVRVLQEMLYSSLSKVRVNLFGALPGEI